jgi:hypothetical protein
MGASARPKRIELIWRTSVQEIHMIEGAPPVDSNSHCETMADRDKELFWTEKFIVPAEAQLNTSDCRINVRFIPPKADKYHACRLCPLCAANGILMRRSKKGTAFGNSVRDEEQSWRIFEGKRVGTLPLVCRLSRYRHIARPVSTTNRSFARSSASLSGLPPALLAKPH